MTLLEFAATHEAALERDAARHIMMLGVFASIRNGQFQDLQTWTLGQPGECAMMRPGRALLLSDLDQAQCRSFAEAMATIPYAGVVGPDQTAHWFVERASELGARFIAPMPQRMHSLAEPPRYPDTAGSARLAIADDTDLLTDWMKEFYREATPHEKPPSRSDVASDIAKGDRCFVWVVDGDVVSTAAIVRRTKTAGGIAGVFTPSHLRAKGYAGSATAAAVEHLFREGRTLACINTDLRNPSSNRCYEKIGFRPVCDAAFYGRAT